MGGGSDREDDVVVIEKRCRVESGGEHDGRATEWNRGDLEHCADGDRRGEAGRPGGQPVPTEAIAVALDDRNEMRNPVGDGRDVGVPPGAIDLEDQGHTATLPTRGVRRSG